MRVMNALFLIAALGFLIDVLILLFTSHFELRQLGERRGRRRHLRERRRCGSQAGLATGGVGHSVKSTIGAIYSMIGVTLFVWWGTYLSAEFKGAGQRKRQLTTMIGAGLGQGLLVLLGIFIFLHRVGHDFFASALAGNYTQGGGAVGTAGYAYFSALVAGNSAAVIFLALLFLGWWLPLLNVNLVMTQRALFTWSFDGLLPKRFGEVDDRHHTPLVAIASSVVTGGACAAWVAWGGANFFKIFAIMQFFAYIPIAVMGVSAILMKWRRRDLYEGSPAQWRIAGIEVLPVAGVFALAWACFAIFLVFYFHENIGLVGGYYTATYIAPFAVWAVAGIWWYVARSVRRSQGVDLSLAYKSIPPPRPRQEPYAARLPADRRAAGDRLAAARGDLSGVVGLPAPRAGRGPGRGVAGPRQGGGEQRPGIRAGWRGHVRLNFATAPQVLTEAVGRIRAPRRLNQRV